jgi:DNA-binding MarR family transcriptional regulator
MAIKLTVNERILLHLRRYYTVQKDVEAPHAVTQKGIADAIDIRVTHVPRSVKKLEEDGLIYESVMHIKGLDKRRKAYFLTEKGMFSANELKRTLGERKVTFKDSEGNVTEKKIAEIEDGTELKLSLLELIGLLDRESILSYQSMEILANNREKGILDGETTLFDFPHKIPVTPNFVGRKKEISSLQKWISDENCIMICVSGERGMGKSSLVANVISDRKNEVSIFWFDSERGEGFDDMVEVLADFFTRLNKTELKTALRGKERGQREILKGLKATLFGAKAILVFDTLDLADPPIHKFIMGLSQELDTLSGAKIIIVHRGFMNIVAKDAVASKSFKSLKLSGLDKDSCKSILGIKKLEKREFERIYKLTEGNPLALKLIREEDISDLKKSGKYTADELTLIRYLKTLDKI